jgi:hypothetical protein
VLRNCKISKALSDLRSIYLYENEGFSPRLTVTRRGLFGLLLGGAAATVVPLPPRPTFDLAFRPYGSLVPLAPREPYISEETAFVPLDELIRRNGQLMLDLIPKVYEPGRTLRFLREAAA